MGKGAWLLKSDEGDMFILLSPVSRLLWARSSDTSSFLSRFRLIDGETDRAVVPAEEPSLWFLLMTSLANIVGNVAYSWYIRSIDTESTPAGACITGRAMVML